MECQCMSKQIDLTPSQREAIRNQILQQLDNNQITLGEAVAQFRKQLTNLTQTQYASLIKISRRSLQQIETDTGNPSLQTISKVLKPMGMKMGIKLK